MITTGIRLDESNSRSNRGGMEVLGTTKKGNIILTNDNDSDRRFFEKCELRAKAVCNPIIEWGNADIWDYIYSEHIECNPLYCNGFDRVGCIGCPLADKKRYFEFKMYPIYKQMYINAFWRMLNVRKLRGMVDEWKTGEDVFAWWMNEDANQISIDEWMEDTWQPTKK